MSPSPLMIMNLMNRLCRKEEWKLFIASTWIGQCTDTILKHNLGIQKRFYFISNSGVWSSHSSSHSQSCYEDGIKTSSTFGVWNEMKMRRMNTVTTSSNWSCSFVASVEVFCLSFIAHFTILHSDPFTIDDFKVTQDLRLHTWRSYFVDSM